MVAPSVLQHRLEHPSAAPFQVSHFMEQQNQCVDAAHRKTSTSSSIEASSATPTKGDVVDSHDVSHSPAGRVAEGNTEVAEVGRSAYSQKQSWSSFIRTKVCILVWKKRPEFCGRFREQGLLLFFCPFTVFFLDLTFTGSFECLH